MPYAPNSPNQHHHEVLWSFLTFCRHCTSINPSGSGSTSSRASDRTGLGWSSGFWSGWVTLLLVWYASIFKFRTYHRIQQLTTFNFAEIGGWTLCKANKHFFSISLLMQRLLAFDHRLQTTFPPQIRLECDAIQDVPKLKIEEKLIVRDSDDRRDLGQGE